ncbi:MAG: MCE family protein [Epsilonproteobacteria bacterium]|nr:MCE family protein [Campylobacterota bacterium]NPA88839.1 MCE family protein [Campylobacterota bacterium]
MKTEFKVGLFFLLGIASLLYLTFRVKDVQNWKEKGYPLEGIINDATGLSIGAKVKMQGVNIGTLKGMELNGTKVLLKMVIKQGIKVPVGSKVTLGQENFLGGKYVRIIPSEEHTYYKPGSVITQYLPTASMEDVLNNVNKAVSEVRVILQKINEQILDANTTRNLRLTVANVQEASVQLKELLGALNQKIPGVIDNANSLISTYKKTGKIINSRLPRILAKVDNLMASANRVMDTIDRNISSLAGEYKKVGENVNVILTENRKGIKGALNSAQNFFAEGGKSFKKLDKFLGSFTKSVLDVQIGGDYYGNDGFYRSYADLTYIPKPTKYYMLSVVDTRDYSSWDKVRQDDKDKFLISAQLGKRYGNWLVRGGIIENTGGVGLDYFALKDNLKLSGDLFDFNGDNDVRGDKAHLRLTGRYLFLKHLYLRGGIDNILNSDARNFFIGAGIKFQDNDLKSIAVGGASSFLK